MNKFGAVLALVAACIAATCAGPVFTPQTVNWSAVGEKIDEMESTMQSNIAQIKTLASNDNAAIGNTIGSDCDAAMGSARAIFQQARTTAQQQRMTEGQARSMMGQLMSVIGKLRGSAERHLYRLTPSTATNIRTTFRDCQINVETKTDQLCAVLRNSGVLMVNWDNVAAKVNEIASTVRDTTEQIKTIASNDNAAAGNSIGAKIDSAMIMVKRILGQASAAAEAHTMTNSQAGQWIGQIKGELGKLKGVIQVDLRQLSRPASAQIQSMFGNCFGSLDRMTSDLQRMLRM